MPRAHARVTSAEATEENHSPKPSLGSRAEAEHAFSSRMDTARRLLPVGRFPHILHASPSITPIDRHVPPTGAPHILLAWFSTPMY